MSFKLGDSVMVLDEDLSGTVTEIRGNSIIIETDDGFLMSFSKTELVKINADSDLKQKLFSNTNAQSVISEKETVSKHKQKRADRKEHDEATMEIDLHINQLVKYSKGMSNHEMLTLQLDTAKRQLEFAISKRIPKIVFIHGVGEGVLKVELEYLFGRYNIKFYDANYQKYGSGATEVYIYQNLKG